MDRVHDIVIDSPLEGEWKVLRPPGHHPYAFDFVQLDERGKSVHRDHNYAFYTGRISSGSFFCWEKPVLSPVNGEVIRVGNGWADNEYTNIWQTIRLWYNATYRFQPEKEANRLDIRPNAGNYVMIRSSRGYIVFLAHLRNESISVSEGMQVRRGEVLARIGNSGNSTMPHLHINLFDQMDNPFEAKVLPFVFSQYETRDRDGNWAVTEKTLPSAGARVRFR